MKNCCIAFVPDLSSSTVIVLLGDQSS